MDHNANCANALRISTPASRIGIYLIPQDEGFVIPTEHVCASSATGPELTPEMPAETGISAEHIYLFWINHIGADDT